MEHKGKVCGLFNCICFNSAILKLHNCQLNILMLVVW